MSAWAVVAASVGALGAAACAVTSGGDASLGGRSQATNAPYTMAVRRITEGQYRNIVSDVFSPQVVLNARFEPESREDGLQAIGNAHLSVTSSGFEQYFAMANSVSRFVVDERRRADFIPCQPADAAKADDACARQVVEKFGPGLYRRPLTEAEITNRVTIARDGATRAGNFHEGARLALVSLLMDPEFLFRVEGAEPDPERRGQFRMDGYSKASRLSFLLWNSGPDAELLAAAGSGAIHTEAGLKAQVERMAASPKLENGARAFFTDMLQFEHFESLNKDSAAYPKFSQKVADSAREQTLRTLIHHLVEQNGDYREIFTSNQTFIDRALAAVYNVPYPSKQPWTAYTFTEDSQRAGILSQVTFLSLFSHPAASSPTKRGAKATEIFMCQAMPEPPADVDFSKVQALDTGTVRTRLLAHMENEGCASCHQITDPVGLSLEHFDGLGQLRTMENGQVIDVSATLDGRTFAGARGLGQLLHDDRTIPACLVRTAFSYGVGRIPAVEEEAFVAQQVEAFAAGGYRFRNLLASLTTSPGFFRVIQPEGLETRQPGLLAAVPTQIAQGGAQ